MNTSQRPPGRQLYLPGWRRRRLLAATLAGLTAFTGPAVFVGVPAAAASPALLAEEPTAVSPDPTEVADEATAMSLAWKNGRPVEILNERTELSETFAQPDGALRVRNHAKPQRVRRGAGWVPVDTNLKVQGDGVLPEATTLDVRFSKGGAGPMIILGAGENSLALQWPYGDLPAPQLLHNTATYPEVLPGVDLQLAAEADSYTQVLVVKTPEAAKDARLAKLEFPIKTEGVTARQEDDGFIRAVDESGATVFVSDGASMWDKPVEQEPAEQPPAEQPPAEQPPASEPPAEQPPAEQPPAEQPPASEPPVDDPQGKEPSTEQPPKEERPVPQPPAEQPGAPSLPTQPKPGVGGTPDATPNRVARPDLDPAKANVEPTITRDIPVELSDNTLTVTPAADLLNDSEVTYPLYIDPGFNGGKEIWTHVSKQNPGKSFWTDANRKDMRVGQKWGGSTNDDWRTLVQFNVAKLKGTKIKKAAVLVNVRHTGDCTKSPFQLWRTDPINRSAAVTWNNTKDRWWKRLAEVQATANKSSCPKSNDEVKFNQAAVLSAFQDAANKKQNTITLSFRARSESDKYQWKKLVADSTYLDIEYNNVPGKPTGLSFRPCYVACASPAVTSTPRPTLTMKASDADGGKLRYEYEVYDNAKRVVKTTSRGTMTGIASGTSRSWTLKTSLPDGQYHWRGKACDTYHCGPYSNWFSFKVDNANPANPKVSSVLYKPTGWHGAPGREGEFVITPGSAKDGVRVYTYSLNGGREVPVTPGGGGVGKVKIKPPKDLINILRVKAIDTAGNLSGGTEYVFRVAPISEHWYWSLDEATGAIANSEPDNSRPMTIGGTGVSWEEPGKSGAAVELTGAGDLTTASTVLNTLSGSGFTVAAWARLPGRDPVAAAAADPDAPPTPIEEHAEPGDDPESEAAPENNALAEDPTEALPTRNMTVLSQDGTKTSAFRLGYRTDVDLDRDGKNDPSWCFTVAGTNVANPTKSSACTWSYVRPGAWVHLVGIVNPITNRIQLYVNGIPARDGVLAERPGRTTWEATGKFAVGRGSTNNAADERWEGRIDEVHATPRIWTEAEIYDKAHIIGEDEEGAPSATDVWQLSMNGTRSASLLAAGGARVKEGALDGPWTTVYGNARQVVVSGNRTGVITNEGTVLVKEGAVGGPWTTIHSGGAKQLVMAGNRIGVLTNGGVALVREGALTAGWVTEYSGVQSLALYGNRIGVLTTAGVALVKEGNLSAAWSTQSSGVIQLVLEGNRIGVVTNTGTALGKQGALGAGWVTLYTDVKYLAMAGYRVGVVHGNNVAMVKEGTTLSAAWTTVHTNAWRLELAAARVGVIDLNWASVINQGAVNAPWVTQ